ncbi:MAG: polysaccharide deacetylase family protein [Armatimonadota bacterium]
MIKKALKNAREISTTAVDICTLRYPGFIYGGGFRNGQIPVFCFHGVEPESLEAMLVFLKINNYTTLNADEYISILTGKSLPPRRSVVLTFDDGWGSLWSTGFPLIKKYDIRIVVFLPPGRIEHSSQYNPTLDDAASGRISTSRILDRDSSDHPLLTWEEIAEMHRSGLVDFQSHSYSHRLIYRSSNIVDFMHPDLLKPQNLLELPYENNSSIPRTIPPVKLGEPIYESAPRLSDIPGIRIRHDIGDACTRLVEENGGAGFFNSGDWRIKLRNEAIKMLNESGTDWQTETPEEQIEAIRFELLESKRKIEEELPGKTVRHLCYPWHAAGSYAVSLAKEAGFYSSFWGRIDGRYYTLPGTAPERIARVGADFFFRLPGTGRISLLKILLDKAARRAKTGSPYLAH